MTRSFLLSFAVASLLVGCSPTGERAEIDAMIDGVIKTYGGLERLQEVEGYRMSGQLFAVQRGQQVRTQRWFQRPDRLRVELHYPGHSEVRFTDGELAWVSQGSGDFQPASPIMVQSMRLQTLRLDFPIRLHEGRADVEHLGPDEQGRARLRLRIDDQLAVTWHVDPGSFRIPKVTMDMTGPPAMQFSAEYDLFHFVAGVLVAFHEKTYSGNVQTSEFQATDFEVNPPRLDEMVRIPADI